MTVAVAANDLALRSSFREKTVDPE